MVQPTLAGRTQALDVLRGFAVLGIFIANVPSFASPEFGAMGMGTTHTYQGWDLWLQTAATVLVAGKMRSMLAILFGVGLYLQFSKRSNVEGNWPLGYVKRSLWLGLFGLLHGVLIWHGDILSTYSVIAIAVALMVRADDRVLKVLIGCGFALATVITLGVGAISMFAPSGGSGGDSGINPFFNLEASFASGTYLDQVQARILLYAVVMVFLAFMVVSLIPLFLLGVLFGRSGVLAKPSAHPKTRNAALAVGLGLGIPLNLVGLGLLFGKNEFTLVIELLAGPVLAIGYLMLGAILVEKGALRWLTDALAKVGRVAFSVYISQSILASIIFYSWGLGLFGKLPYAGQLAVVPIVWAINIAFAHLWLRRYPMGPLEWLLRSLTDGRRILATST